MDETVSEMYQRTWECWKNNLIGSEKIELKRCIKSGGFSKIVHISLHSFSDPSEVDYGESSYLRLADEYGHIHCTLMIAKARVAPRRFVSILLLELVAAVLAVKISALIKKELEMEELIEYFWTDSKVVLGNIANDSRALKTFVSINFATENLHILDASQIQQAEICIIKLVQSKYFTKEMKTVYEEARIRRGRNKEEQSDLQFRPLYR